jgi:hypothetical protein
LVTHHDRDVMALIAASGFCTGAGEESTVETNRYAWRRDLRTTLRRASGSLARRFIGACEDDDSVRAIAPLLPTR